ncbi:MAG: hypothetical protein DBP03_04785 [gamma proteobacterium symbiont of Ctena orbiculata]|nr:MAG: hypothetical protein DBP03_04785 [gamma proteobacterium symbiont of Ctena orbiculata]PUB79392.1 MAG: hypothetical protein DBO99_04575 [gamma proteobacterium symbiont of Ctena orbiculata]
MSRMIVSMMAVIFVTISLFAATVFGNSLSQDLESRLAVSEPEEEIAIIITMAEKADLSKIKKLSTLERRRALPQVLRSHAETTQADLIKYLKTKGSRNLRSIWVTNLLAATVRSELIPMIAERTDVSAIRLDKELPFVSSPKSIDAAPVGQGD